MVTDCVPGTVVVATGPFADGMTEEDPMDGPGDDRDNGIWSYRVAYFTDSRKWRLIEAYYSETVPGEIEGWCPGEVDEGAESLDDLRNDVLAMVDAFTRPALKIDGDGNVVGRASVPICRRPR